MKYYKEMWQFAPKYIIYNWSIDWLTDWLTDWMIVWLITHLFSFVEKKEKWVEEWKQMDSNEDKAESPRPGNQKTGRIPFRLLG